MFNFVQNFLKNGLKVYKIGTNENWAFIHGMGWGAFYHESFTVV